MEDLKALILQTLEKEGLGLIALNAAMYAADKSDKIATVRVQMRNQQADKVIWTSAATKSVVVAFSPGLGVDIVSGIAIDALMVVTLSRVYGLNFSMAQARNLSKAIGKAAGWFALGELTSWGGQFHKSGNRFIGDSRNRDSSRCRRRIQLVHYWPSCQEVFRARWIVGTGIGQVGRYRYPRQH